MPNLKEIDFTSHTLVILEDMIDYIQTLPKEKIALLCSFVKASRHQNVSLMVVLHDFAFNRQKNSFERMFLEQSSLIVIFAFTMNKHQLRNFIYRIFADKTYFRFFLEAFEMSNKICKIDNSLVKDTKHFKRPFVMISVENYKSFNDPLLSLRIDPFKRNITFKMGLS